MQGTVLSELALQILLVVDEIRRGTKITIFESLCRRFPNYRFVDGAVNEIIDAMHREKLLTSCMTVSAVDHFIVSDRGIERLRDTDFYRANTMIRLSHAA